MLYYYLFIYISTGYFLLLNINILCISVDQEVSKNKDESFYG